MFFPSHWLLSYITIVKTKDCGERGMNPVAMTIINPWEEYWASWRSNQRPVSKSTMLPICANLYCNPSTVVEVMVRKNSDEHAHIRQTVIVKTVSFTESGLVNDTKNGFNHFTNNKIWTLPN